MMKSRTRKILVSNYKCRGGGVTDWGLRNKTSTSTTTATTITMSSDIMSSDTKTTITTTSTTTTSTSTTLTSPSSDYSVSTFTRVSWGQWGGSPHPQTTLSQPQLQVSYSLEVSGEDHPSLTLLFFNLHQSLLLSYLKYSLSNCSRIVIKFY